MQKWRHCWGEGTIAAGIEFLADLVGDKFGNAAVFGDRTELATS